MTSPLGGVSAIRGTMETYHGSVDSLIDVHLVIEATRRGILPRVKRRPTDKHRAGIRSGSTFVYLDGEAGLKRWTDGRTWSPSRAQGAFLVYRECIPRDELPALASRLAALARGEDDSALVNTTPVASRFPLAQLAIKRGHRGEYCLVPGGLYKRTITVTTRDGGVYHLVTYTNEDATSADSAVPLASPTTDPELASRGCTAESIPTGVFGEPPVPAAVQAHGGVQHHHSGSHGGVQHHHSGSPASSLGGSSVYELASPQSMHASLAPPVPAVPALSPSAMVGMHLSHSPPSAQEWIQPTGASGHISHHAYHHHAALAPHHEQHAASHSYPSPATTTFTPSSTVHAAPALPHHHTAPAAPITLAPLRYSPPPAPPQYLADQHHPHPHQQQLPPLPLLQPHPMHHGHSGHLRAPSTRRSPPRAQPYPSPLPPPPSRAHGACTCGCAPIPPSPPPPYVEETRPPLSPLPRSNRPYPPPTAEPTPGSSAAGVPLAAPSGWAGYAALGGAMYAPGRR
ncbi:hypothetical protein H9P43_005660 [Blastocladiella emersonii ATCC 22665]|nr:hypothetical protein H9P43_005660 [Blastocladiella emersonii ATCC 22665]